MAFIKPKIKNQRQWLVVGLLFIVIVLVALGELTNRLDYAQNNLTEKDYRLCLEDINSVSYINCWTYLNETGEKDISAIWEGT